MRRVRIKPRYVLEYWLLRALAGLINLLPYRLALALGWGVAWISFYGVGFRVPQALARIQAVFPGRFSQREVRRLAWLSWRNFVFCAVEMMRIPSAKPAWIRAVVDASAAAQPIREHLQASGQGAIIATIHMGSWEMASLACLASGLPLFSLAASQKNPLVDAYLNRLRASSGFETVLRTPSVLKTILRKIRAGKVLAILPDVRSPTPGLAINFLGQKMNAAGGMGLIARQTRVPIFPCVITRVGWARHRYRSFAPIYPDQTLAKEADWLRMTQAAFDIFERCIREEPEQWFWFNKRWVLDPLVAPAKEPSSTAAAPSTAGGAG